MHALQSEDAKADFNGHRPNRRKAGSHTGARPNHDLHLTYEAHDRAVFRAVTERGAKYLRALGYSETGHVQAYLLSRNALFNDVKTRVSGSPRIPSFCEAR